MNKTKVCVILAIFVGLQILAIGIYFRNRAIGDEGNAADAIADEERERQSIEGRVPVQRRRIDDFISQVGAYPTYEALAAALNDPVRVGDDFDVVLAAGLQSQDPIPEMQFARVLADRRVSRLYAMLKKLDANVAAERAAALFDDKLHVHEQAMANGIATTRLVVAMARAGMLGVFGAAGLPPGQVEAAIDTIEHELGPDGPSWATNLIHSPADPELESPVL